MRRAAIVLGALVLLYATAVGAFYWQMKQPPETFARMVSKLPPPVPFVLLPFPAMWRSARAGALQPGGMAPDFDLETLDRQSRVRLSQYRGVRPVALIFGSYT